MKLFISILNVCINCNIINKNRKILLNSLMKDTKNTTLTCCTLNITFTTTVLMRIQ